MTQDVSAVPMAPVVREQKDAATSTMVCELEAKVAMLEQRWLGSRT